jgi:hypothetical protein
VNQEYDLFEKFSDGSVLWKESVAGLENAVAKLKHLASLSSNEHFALHSPSNATVARMNVPKSDPAERSE